MTRARKAALAVGLAYIAGIVVLYVAGEGIAAAYLTFPGGVAVVRLIDWVPLDTALGSVVMSWTGNLIVLLVSATVNVTALYIVVRLLSKR
jgi:hypothetical protein